MKAFRRHDRGSALILAAVVVIIMAGLGAAFLTLSFYQNKATFNAAMSEGALYSCEAGLEDALNKMNAYAQSAWDYMRAHNSDNPSAYYPPPDADFNCFYRTYEYTSTTTTDQTTTTTMTPTAMTVMVRRGMYPGMPDFNQFPLNRGTYSVEIRPAFDGSKRPYTIKATGTHGQETRRIEVVATPGPANGPFRYGLFGEVLLNVYGTSTGGLADVKVDSYKSSLGTYASQMTSSITVDGKLLQYARSNGNIAANGDVVASNSMVIMGNVSAGPGVSPQTNGAYVSGSVASLSERETFDPVVINTTGGTTIAAINGNATFSAGGTYVTPSFNINSHEKVTFQGSGNPAAPRLYTLIVEGDIVANGQAEIVVEAGAKVEILQKAGGYLQLNGGGITNFNGTPGNFILRSQSTDVAAKVNGGAAFYGAIYAPSTALTLIGNGEIFGAVVANQIIFGGAAQFHYDEDLNAQNYTPPVYNVKSWREKAD